MKARNNIRTETTMDSLNQSGERAVNVNGSSVIKPGMLSDIEDDILVDFREIDKDWSDVAAPVPIRSTSNHVLKNYNHLLPDVSPESLDGFLPFHDPMFGSTATARALDICQSSDLESASSSLEPTPIDPSGKMLVVDQIDMALTETFRSSSLSDTFYENMSLIFDLPNERRQRNLVKVTDGVDTQNNMAFSLLPSPKSNGRLCRESSITSTASSASEGRSVADRWNDRYQDLKAFVQKHGHCHVPINYKENPLLSRWTKRQRYQWKLKQEGKQSSLTDARQLMLEELGFLWDVRSIIWDVRFRELVQFYENHGHCNVSINCKEFPKLVSETSRLEKMSEIWIAWLTYFVPHNFRGPG
jgi:Helicase associated domain